MATAALLNGWPDRGGDDALTRASLDGRIRQRAVHARVASANTQAERSGGRDQTAILAVTESEAAPRSPAADAPMLAFEMQRAKLPMSISPAR
jgi:hypothetical protein